jgi:hypothetical protein
LSILVGEKSGEIHVTNKNVDSVLNNNIQHPYDKLKKVRPNSDDIVDINDENDEDDEIIDNPIAHRECSSNLIFFFNFLKIILKYFSIILR